MHLLIWETLELQLREGGTVLPKSSLVGQNPKSREQEEGDSGVTHT